MDNTSRGVLRCSSVGLTKSRIAWRLCVKAEAETSAQTGRPSILGVFVTFTGSFAGWVRGGAFLDMVCVCAMVFPEEKIVYDICAAGADSPRGCRVKDNSAKQSNRSASLPGFEVCGREPRKSLSARGARLRSLLQSRMGSVPAGTG